MNAWGRTGAGKALRDDTAEEIEFLQAIGCTYVAVPIFRDEHDRYDPVSYRRFAQEVVPVAEALGAHEITLGYHNHAHEFMRPDGGGPALFDVLIDEAPEVALELDVYWAAVAGVDPARLLERLQGRVDYLHVKDLTLVRGRGWGAAAAILRPGRGRESGLGRHHPGGGEGVDDSLDRGAGCVSPGPVRVPAVELSVRAGGAGPSVSGEARVAPDRTWSETTVDGSRCTSHEHC